MSVDQHVSMQDDLQMMTTEADNRDKYDQRIQQQAAEFERRQSQVSFDFDRALIFVRRIHVRVSTFKFSHNNIKHHKHEYLKRLIVLTLDEI